MARAIIRISLDGPSPNSALQAAKGKLVPPLALVRNTGTVEGYGSDSDILSSLRRLLDHLQNGLPTGIKVDHLWIYLDKTDPPVGA